MGLALLVLLLPLAAIQPEAVRTATRPARHVIVSPVGIADARWTTGFWAERFATCHKATVPSMAILMEGTKRSQFLHNFRIAAGLVKGEHKGPAWNDGDTYKWLEAAAAVFAITGDPALDRMLDVDIAIIVKAQRSDGYLHTPVLIANRNGKTAVQPFQDRLNFEMYNLGHLFTAACVHHQATGKRTLLDVAVKAADYLCDALASPTVELSHYAICPSHFMGLIDLYRATGNRKYLNLAISLCDQRDQSSGGTDDNQDRVPFRRQTAAVGHAVRANYLYAGAADIYAETGDATLLEPLQAIWANVVTRKMYLTGACGALYDGASPDGAAEQKQISRVHQAYGRDYQLPNSTAHNETCAAIGNVLWNARMLQVTGDAKYGDVLELALYNALLAGISLDGQRFFYTNTLRQVDPMPVPLRWSRNREEWIRCYCCPPNVARTIAQVNRLAYGRSNRGVWIHLYGSSALDTVLTDGRRFKLRQEADYPWDGRIKVAIESAPAEETSLFLRIPGWAGGAALSVNRQPQAIAPGRYAEIRRTWTAGDSVELTLPLEPRLMEAHPLVEEDRNQAAVMRGPIVYCLESTDLPAGVPLQDVRLCPDGALAPRFDRNLLGGVSTLTARAQLVANATWKHELYRELRTAPAKLIDVRLIPYYAWSNRGPSQMTVWLPLGR